MSVDLFHISLSHPIILFDGECHLCDNSVQFVLKRDKSAVFRFCSLQYAREHTTLEVKTDSVILLENKKIYSHNTAALKILSRLGGFYKILSTIAGIVPTSIADTLYDFIAKNRYKWFGKYDTCIIPEPQWKDRFIS